MEPKGILLNETMNFGYGSVYFIIMWITLLSGPEQADWLKFNTYGFKSSRAIMFDPRHNTIVVSSIGNEPMDYM